MSILQFPVKTEKKHTPTRKLRMDDALTDALIAYGKRSGIGGFSSVVRFACASLLRSEGTFQVTPTAADKAAK